MSRYFVDIKEKAQLDLAKLKKDEPKFYAKALKLIGELYEHPCTGTGKPKQLSADRAGRCTTVSEAAAAGLASSSTIIIQPTWLSSACWPDSFTLHNRNASCNIYNIYNICNISTFAISELLALGVWVEKKY